VLQAANTLNSLLEFLSKLNLIKKNGAVSAAVREKVESAAQEFYEKMDDDFNTPEALAVLFKLVGGFQSQIQSLNKKEAGLIADAAVKYFNIVRADLPSTAIPSEVRALLASRERTRLKRDFSRADRLRKKIEKLGYKVEDTPLGPACWKNIISDYNA
jgi:cysteinyl-tRNA synthetase